MNDKNLYLILGISKDSTIGEIKAAYRMLSKRYHPDICKDENSEDIFKSICDAYSILSNNEKRDEYDLKSRYGNRYNEYYELFNINIDTSYEDVKKKRDLFKRNEIDDIIVSIGEDFDGYVEFERWTRCKSCDGTGKNLSNKIVIKDVNGNITKIFEGEDGCDLCDGTGEYRGGKCPLCYGKGKVGINMCSSCKGESRILGKQKISNIKLKGKETVITSMGHYSKNGKIGNLIIKSKD